MKKSIILSIIALALAANMPLHAQYNETNNLFYHTFRTPQSNNLNPAFFPTNNTFYLQTFGMGIQFGGPLSIRDVMSPGTDAQGNSITVIDINKMLNAFDNNNRLRFGLDIELLGFGLKIGDIFVDFNTRMYTGFSFGLPTTTVNALLEGNADNNGDPLSEISLLDGDVLNINSYVEASIGGGYHFDKLGLTVGAHAKLLYGVLSAQTDNTRITLNTSDNYDQLTANLYYEIQAAALAGWDPETNSPKIDFKELTNISKANLGMAFDLGARYDMGPFSFSLAVNDLSAGIHWTNHVNTIRPTGGTGSIRFDGVDVSSALYGGEVNLDTLINQWNEELEDMAPLITYDSGEFWSPIPTKLNLGASYSFAKICRAGLLLHGQWDRGLLSKSNPAIEGSLQDIKNTFRFNTTLSVGVNVFNWAEVIVGSSVVYDGNKLSPLNPGVGLVLTPATVMQFYLMADYASSIYLAETKAFNIKFGFNWLFGKGGRNSIVAAVAD